MRSVAPPGLGRGFLPGDAERAGRSRPVRPDADARARRRRAAGRRQRLPVEVAFDRADPSVGHGQEVGSAHDRLAGATVHRPAAHDDAVALQGRAAGLERQVGEPPEEAAGVRGDRGGRLVRAGIPERPVNREGGRDRVGIAAAPRLEVARREREWIHGSSSWTARSTDYHVHAASP
jgi:hypothetical protein